MVRSDKIKEAFYFRHACKIFDADKKIDRKDFETILEAGRLSPSSFGFEPWQFLVVQNETLRERLREYTWGAQDTLPSASHFVVMLARKQPSLLADSDYVTHMMYDIHGIEKEAAEARREKYRIFQTEDFKLLENERAIFDWAGKQVYIALGNIMTVAAMLGIDSCAVEGFRADAIETLIAEAFGIDTDIFGVAVMVAFGYRLHPQKPKTRQTAEDIVKWYL